MTQVNSIRIVHSNEALGTSSGAFGTQLNHVLELQFDTAGELVSGTVGKTRDVAFPVPLPPGAGGVTLPYPKHTLDATDGHIRVIAKQIHRVAVQGGGVTDVWTENGSRMISGTRASGSFLEHFPGGAPLVNDAARMGRSNWGNLVPTSNTAYDLARLGSVLRRLA